jgi:hypothetical protein
MKIQRQVGLRATMSDGTVLVADAWVPEGNGTWPVLLQRLPYGRSVASTPVLPHPSWVASHGYAVVVQDCRGRGDSGGTFEPFLHEASDGAETIEWAARLPFANGLVATYGFSYQGLNQLYAAATRPPSLRAIAPMMCGPDPREGWTYEGGALRWPFVCFWAAQLAGQDLRTGPIPFDTGASTVATALGDSPPRWFADWVTRADDDAYWAARRPDIEQINVPAFSVLGWFDDFSSGTASLVERLGATAWCGPWSHMPWGTVHSGVDFGPDASPAPIWEALIRFFDRALGKSPHPSEEPAVQYYVIGEGWRSSASWPPSTVESRWRGVSPTGNALSRWGDGRLARADEPLLASRPVSLVSEPHVPVPGGPLDFQDERATHDRRDVVCFSSDPLLQPVVVSGSPEVRLRTTCDRPRHDVVATLCIVDPSGQARVVSSYAQRALRPIAPGEGRDWMIRLRPIAIRVDAGSRLRLTIAGSRFPCYDRNPHTETNDPSTDPSSYLVATIEISDVELLVPCER